MLRSSTESWHIRHCLLAAIAALHTKATLAMAAISYGFLAAAGSVVQDHLLEQSLGTIIPFMFPEK